jgi:hypothetical protein
MTARKMTVKADPGSEVQVIVKVIPARESPTETTAPERKTTATKSRPRRPAPRQRRRSKLPAREVILYDDCEGEIPEPVEDGPIYRMTVAAGLEWYAEQAEAAGHRGAAQAMCDTAADLRARGIESDEEYFADMRRKSGQTIPLNRKPRRCEG